MPDAEKRRIRNVGDVERAKPGTKTLVAGCSGLYLVCDRPNSKHPEGLKRWMFRYMPPGKDSPTEISIGHVRIGQLRSVSLEQARLAADTHRYHLKHSKMDPQRVKKISQGQRHTFQEAAQEYLKIHGPNKGDRWRRQFKLFTDTYGEKLSRQGVGNILREQVREAIAPVFARTWRQGRETLNLWEDIFGLAIEGRDWRLIENPATWEIHNHNFPKPRGLKVKNHPSLHYAQMKGFMRTLRQYQAQYIAAIALELGILTALRPNKEVRLIQLTEIDFENRILSIPAERMKARKDREAEVFRVPLPDRACALLLHLKANAKGPFVFALSSPNKPMGEATVIKFLRDKMGIPHEGPGAADIHGLSRNPLRDWCEEKNDFDWAAKEMCLDHTIGKGNKTVEAYLRTDLLEKRRIIMDAWAKFIG